MFKTLIGALALLFTIHSYSVTYSTQIREVDHGERGEKILVLLSNGRVAYLPENSDLSAAFEAAARHGSTLQVTLNSAREITSAMTLKEFPDKTLPARHSRGQTYDPTVIPSLDKATTVFKNMNRKANEESQCYNRAHVWSFEMYNNYLVKPNKIFIFFTNKYIRRYSFEWWFHVSPYVHVQEGDQVVERVMDHKYSNGPKLMKEWTDIFMKNDPQCADIEKYTDYEYHRGDANAPWCMLLRSSMYYYQPLDLEALDKKGSVKDFWVEWEIRNAYREAFSYRH